MPKHSLHGSAIDVSGQRFGLLVAREPVAVATTRGRLWRCECDCGRVCYRTAGDLRMPTKTPHSCGCLIGKEPKTLDELALSVSSKRKPFKDCWAWGGVHCTALTEDLCVTRGKCKFYDTVEEYERKQKQYATRRG